MVAKRKVQSLQNCWKIIFWCHCQCTCQLEEHGKHSHGGNRLRKLSIVWARRRWRTTHLIFSQTGDILALIFRGCTLGPMEHLMILNNEIDKILLQPKKNTRKPKHVKGSSSFECGSKPNAKEYPCMFCGSHDSRTRLSQTVSETQLQQAHDARAQTL